MKIGRRPHRSNPPTFPIRLASIERSIRPPKRISWRGQPAIANNGLRRASYRRLVQPFDPAEFSEANGGPC